MFDMKVTLITIDLAKNILQLCGVNQACKPAFNKAIKRNKVFEFLAQYPGVPIAMEACYSSNYWGRELKKLGHEVKLIPPIHVKPFVKGNKNDRNDAFAIAEAAHRPNLQCVQPRTLEQTDLILHHRLKDRRVKARTALVNQLRGFLSEYGIAGAAGKRALFTSLTELLDDKNNGLTEQAKFVVRDIQQEWKWLDKAIEELDKKIECQAKASENTRRLMTLKGVAHTTATAFAAAVGDGTAYKNGRHCAANLGLVPREHSSGGVQKLGGITKRGNGYLRRLLIQGAWSILRYVDKSNDRLSQWAKSIMERRGKQKAVVAVANKMARILWAMSYHQCEYNGSR